MPTYHFAVVVDDAEMGITHVIRGQEHTLNTFKHIALQEALGFPRPTYAHLPVILNKDDGKKMGKRDRDKKVRVAAHNWLKNQKKNSADLATMCGLGADRIDTWLKNDTQQLDLGEQAAVMKVIGLLESDLPEVLVHDFRKNGYLPEALLNFLALLGWNPGGDREKMTMGEMTALFGLDGVNKAGARFDRDKLAAFNTTAAAGADEKRVLTAMRDFLACHPNSPLHITSDEQLLAAIEMCAGYRTFRDVEEKCRSLFGSDDQYAFHPEAVEKFWKKNDGEGLKILTGLRTVLEDVENWDHASIEVAVKQFAESQQLSLGKVAQPLRVAITGTSVSPGIGDSLQLLGRSATLKRIDRAVRFGSE
jgi:glutamyl-tRNA synthetase